MNKNPIPVTWLYTNTPLQLTQDGYLKVQLQETDGSVASPQTVKEIVELLELEGVKVV